MLEKYKPSQTIGKKIDNQIFYEWLDYALLWIKFRYWGLKEKFI